MKCILIYFNPKDLPEVLKEYDKIHNIDKVMFRYFSYPEVIHMAKAWLEFHPEYTHAMIASNDIVVKEENIKRMYQVMGDYPVLCGVINVDYQDYRFINVCKELPEKHPDRREYKWLKKRKRGIIKVAHSGFGLMCVRRDIILEDGFWNAYKQVSMDLNFSYHCRDNDIDIYADTENIMEHLRHQGEFLRGNGYNPTIIHQINGKR